MTSLLTPETFEFFALFLLAGYVVIIVRSRFVSGLRPKPSEVLIEAVLFSLIIQLIALGLSTFARWIGAFTFIENTFGFSIVAGQLPFFAKVLILPAILGACLGYSLNAGWKNALLRRLSLPIIHPAQTGHDFAFGNNREAGFVIVTYFDGAIVAGYFGEKSLAASDTAHSDLYLERVYLVGENEQWVEPNPKRSALISLDTVRSIEFLDPERESHD